MKRYRLFIKDIQDVEKIPVTQYKNVENVCADAPRR